MQSIIIGLTCVIVLGFVLLIYRALYVSHQSKMRINNKLKLFQPLIGKLSKKEHIESADLTALAENPSTRQALFGILEGYGRADMFPLNYYTMEKAAESFLVNWLEFPTELNATPEEIEFVTSITIVEPTATLDYFVFKYKKFFNLDKSKDPWMLGVAGPYTSASQPYDVPLRVFSRFNAAGTVNPLDEVRWVHENIARKGRPG
jgi:hypothetical protein